MTHKLILSLTPDGTYGAHMAMQVQTATTDGHYWSSREAEKSDGWEKSFWHERAKWEWPEHIIAREATR